MRRILGDRDTITPSKQRPLNVDHAMVSSKRIVSSTSSRLYSAISTIAGV